MTKFLKIGSRLINLDQVAEIELESTRGMSKPNVVLFAFNPADGDTAQTIFSGDEAESIREFFGCRRMTDETRAVAEQLPIVLDITPVAATEPSPL